MKKFGVFLICIILVLTGITGCRRPPAQTKRSLPKPENREQLRVMGAGLSLKDFEGDVRWDLELEEVHEDKEGLRLTRVTGVYYPPQGGHQVTIAADEGWIDPEYSRLELRNNVKMERQKLSLSGDSMKWDAASGMIRLTGGVHFETDGMQGRGDIVTSDASLNNVRFLGGSTWRVMDSPSRPLRRKD